MICQPCRKSDHDNCDDKMVAVPLPAISKLVSHVSGEDKQAVRYEPRTGRLYRSCACQHKVREVQPLAPAQVT